jgi:hypothetical protein
MPDKSYLRDILSLAIPAVVLLAISGYAIVTPYFQFWFVPKDTWRIQIPATVATFVLFMVILIRFVRPESVLSSPDAASKRTINAACLAFVLIVVLGTVSRICLIQSLKPTLQQIDVPYVNEAAVSSLLQGRNPYNVVYAVRSDGTGIQYNYPPFALLYYVPFVMLGDLRYGNLVADMLAVLGIFLIALKRGRPYSRSLSGGPLLSKRIIHRYHVLGE